MAHIVTFNNYRDIKKLNFRQIINFVVSCVSRSGGFTGEYAFSVKPWYRFGPYAIGMALGLLMLRTNCKVKLHWVSFCVEKLQSHNEHR